MEPIFFTKLTTTGTSHIILNYLEQPVPKLDHAHLAKQMTHVESGVGADGLILLLLLIKQIIRQSFITKTGPLQKYVPMVCDSLGIIFLKSADSLSKN